MLLMEFGYPNWENIERLLFIIKSEGRWNDWRVLAILDHSILARG